jgi:3-methyladenine DNA glycosylase AlkD
VQTIEQWIERAARTQHGFTDIKRAADEIAAEMPTTDSLRLAHELFKVDLPQARMLAVYLFGCAAVTSSDTLSFMKTEVSRDPNWRVQEILAQAFDSCCAALGYQKALPVIEDWLQDPSANVRRAVTEGLRIWTSRPYFREHPAVAVCLLSEHREHESEYLRKSVGNALRDISRRHPGLVRAELAGWDLSNKRVKQVYKLASRFLEGD